MRKRLRGRKDQREERVSFVRETHTQKIYVFPIFRVYFTSSNKPRNVFFRYICFAFFLIKRIETSFHKIFKHDCLNVHVDIS